MASDLPVIFWNRSLTASLNFCLHPMYRSVVWTERDRAGIESIRVRLRHRGRAQRRNDEGRAALGDALRSALHIALLLSKQHPERSHDLVCSCFSRFACIPALLKLRRHEANGRLEPCTNSGRAPFAAVRPSRTGRRRPNGLLLVESDPIVATRLPIVVDRIRAADQPTPRLFCRVWCSAEWSSRGLGLDQSTANCQSLCRAA
jgi:hypothetical protein